MRQHSELRPGPQRTNTSIETNHSRHEDCMQRFTRQGRRERPTQVTAPSRSSRRALSPSRTLYRRPSHSRVSFMLVPKDDFTSGLDVETQIVDRSLISFDHPVFHGHGEHCLPVIQEMFPTSVVTLGPVLQICRSGTRLAFRLGSKPQRLSGHDLKLSVDSYFAFVASMMYSLRSSDIAKIPILLLLSFQLVYPAASLSLIKVPALWRVFVSSTHVFLFKFGLWCELSGWITTVSGAPRLHPPFIKTVRLRVIHTPVPPFIIVLLAVLFVHVRGLGGKPILASDFPVTAPPPNPVRHHRHQAL